MYALQAVTAPIVVVTSLEQLDDLVGAFSYFMIFSSLALSPA